MDNNKKNVELLWANKYDKFEKGERIPIEKPNLPFQVAETVNKPRLKDLEGGLFNPSQIFPEDKYPENYPTDWKNKLTQKPEGLLQVLLMATTEPGDLVADFFCGRGTTLAVAEKLGRCWIGCDLSKFAI